jgi:hypothetical protein
MKMTESIQPQPDEIDEMPDEQNQAAALVGASSYFVGPEAPAVVSVDLWSPKGAKVMLTVRTNSVIEGIDTMMKAIEYAWTNYRMSVSIDAARATNAAPDTKKQAPAPAPAPSPSTVTPPPVVIPAQAPKPAAPAPVTPPSAPATPGGGYVDATKINILARPTDTSGKVTIEFWMADRQYPELRTAWKPEKVAEEFNLVVRPDGEHWTVGNVVPGLYDGVRYRVHWTPSSKLNDRNQPFKNIVSVEPF